MCLGSWVLIAGLIATGSACSHGGAASGGASEPRPADLATTVNVINHYGHAVDIYAAAAGTSYRMGTVAPGIDGHFVLRPAMVSSGPVELVAQLGGNEPPVQSGQLLLVPGDVVDFEITAQLINSTATVRP